jgi:hypothetical protein
VDHLISLLRLHFDSLEDRMRCFATLGVQVEGWFKGELLLALNSCREKEAIQGFDREVKAKESRKTDLKVVSRGLH